MPTNNNFSDMQDRNLQTLNDIQGLQSIETELFNNLESGIANNTLTTVQQNAIINKINEISQMRMNLYNNLNGMYNFFKNNLSSIHDTIDEQTAAIGIVENELNESKKKLDMLNQENINKLKLIEINTYYGDKYNEQANIMKDIVFACIPIIIITILYNIGILPRFLFSFLLIIVVSISIIKIGNRIFWAYFRDNMNYQKYDWRTDKKSLPKIDLSNPSGKNPWVGEPPATCSGQACCYTGTSYDIATNKCVPSELLNENTHTSTGSSSGSSSAQNSGNTQSGLFGRLIGGFGGL